MGKGCVCSDVDSIFKRRKEKTRGTKQEIKCQTKKMKAN
jgi:hypothetical protein